MFFKGQQVGRYRVRTPLGTGGFGAVYLAEDTWLGTKVALKVPHQQRASMENLLREPRLLAALDHPNIVRIHTVEREGDVFFIVMEYVDGETLADRIDREGCMQIPEFLGLMEQITSAVESAHERHILHRDLRPANILLTRDGRAKVADFGISRVLDAGHAPTRVGSPPYMAPEQFEGRTVLASDVYALGVIMYEMLTGNLPVRDGSVDTRRERIRAGRWTPPRVRNPDIPEHVNRAVMKAMAPALADRYQRAAELMKGLMRRQPTPEAEGLDDIRERLKAREDRPTPSFCWNCRRPLARRTTCCAYCGEAV